MSAEIIKKRKWFWAWQDDKEEAWLSEMALQGYHLLSANFGSYTFDVGDPEKFVYRLDFFVDPQNQYEDYLQLFLDGGWELVCTFGGWQYFRTHQTDSDVPEIYTDRNSKIVKYQRLMVYLSIFFPIFIITLNQNPDFEGVFSWIYEGVRILVFLYILLYGFAMVKLIQRIQAIKKEDLSNKG